MAVRPLSNAQLAAVLCLDRNITQWNLQRSGYTFTIGRIGFVAIADVADLDFTRCTTYGACRVFKQNVLLCPSHQAEQRTGLRVVICVNAMVPVIRSTG